GDFALISHWLTRLNDHAFHQLLPRSETRGPARGHPRTNARGAGKSGVHPQRFPDAAHRPDEFRAFLNYWNECKGATFIRSPGPPAVVATAASSARAHGRS